MSIPESKASENRWPRRLPLFEMCEFEVYERCLTEPLDGRSVGQEIVLLGGIVGRRTRLAGTGGSLSELTRRRGGPLGSSGQDYTLCARGMYVRQHT